MEELQKNTKTSIVVTLQVEGVHHWPECPLEEVIFLRYKHRHLFYIRLVKEVTHNDRDIEIIMLKHRIQYFLSRYKTEKSPIHDFGRMSCEDIAEKLLHNFQASEVEVLEDGENGAIVRV